MLPQNLSNLENYQEDFSLGDLLVRRYNQGQLDSETNGERLNTYRWLQELRQQRRLIRRRLSTAIWRINLVNANVRNQQPSQIVVLRRRPHTARRRSQLDEQPQ